MANNFKTTIELSAQSPSGNLLYTTLELPATRGEITDAAHRLRNLPVSEIFITGSDALPELADTRLDAPTVDELNFFASRVNALPDDELAALGGVFLHRGNLGEFEDGLTMKDLINMTYGLDGVMIAPNVANDEQLGQFVIDNEMNDDIAALSDEIIELLDRERVGRRQRENEGGEFIRYIRGLFVLPIAYVQTVPPKHRARNWCVYTPEGRADIHKSLEKVNVDILRYLMQNPVRGESIEYNDNRLSLYCAQQGKCAISGKPLVIGEIDCHHKTRRADGGDDRYTNLVLICHDVHVLLHATKEETIRAYLEKLSLNCKQLDKLNRLRKRLNLPPI